MDSSEAQRVRRILAEALSLDSSERSAFLARTCGPHTRLRRYVERLVQLEREAESRFRPPRIEANQPRSSRAELEGVHRELLERLQRRSDNEWRYDIRADIGSGGQGTIREARDKELGRDIAMKLSRALAGSTPVSGTRSLGRFLDEAQITAQLDHPGVVPVHELGLDSQGDLYFTMKLVKGRDLRAIFDLVERQEHGWNRTRALGVLLRVCDAMAYAHMKGVVHRDLKPSNVMVGEYGEVYVMDWGLARVMDHEDRRDLRIRPAGSGVAASTNVGADVDSPLVTMEGDVVGTPAYMSPEQARGDQAEMGPHSDVYSLGAMLYELLSGEMPYAQPGVRQTNHAIWTLVCEGPPPPLRQLAPSAPAELIAICDRAMTRSPKSRYPDMSALAEDLRAFLENRVVAAHESGALAELRKWAQRNKSLASISLGLVLALAVGFVTSLVFRQRAVSEREVSEALADFLINDMIGAALPHRPGTASSFGGLGTGTTVREAVDAAAASLDAELSGEGRFEGQPLVEAKIRTSLGWVYLCAGYNQEAIHHYERAQGLQVAELGRTHRDTLSTMRALGSLYYEAGQLRKAESCLSDARELARRSLGDSDRETLWITCMLGNVLSAKGNRAEGERLWSTALEVCQAHLEPGDPLTLGVMANLANAAIESGRADDAEQLLRDVVEEATGSLGPTDIQTLGNRAELGALLWREGRLEEAQAELSSTVEDLERTQDPLDPVLLEAKSHLRSLYADRGDSDSARSLTEELLSKYAARALSNPDDAAAQRAYAWELLTCVPEDLRDPRTSLAHARRACELTNHDNWAFLDTLASALHETGNTVEAARVQERALGLCPAGALARDDLEARLSKYKMAASSTR